MMVMSTRLAMAAEDEVSSPLKEDTILSGAIPLFSKARSTDSERRIESCLLYSTFPNGLAQPSKTIDNSGY